jgi:hypothetical protein
MIGSLSIAAQSKGYGQYALNCSTRTNSMVFLLNDDQPNALFALKLFQ